MMVCALIGGAYGYYVHNKDDDGYVVASNFFFESDYLSEKGEEYILNTNTTQITFKLKNYADELRCSENDINFVVTSDGATLSIDNGTLEKGKKSTTEITLSNLEKYSGIFACVSKESTVLKSFKISAVVLGKSVALPPQSNKTSIFPLNSFNLSIEYTGKFTAGVKLSGARLVKIPTQFISFALLTASVTPLPRLP